MNVEKCSVVGPRGFCQHDDGDGYWPAASVQTACTEENAILVAEQVAPLLPLPDGWHWASDTAYVHVGPLTGLDGSREVVISRTVRQAVLGSAADW